MDQKLHEQLRVFVEGMPFARQFHFQIREAERGLVEVELKPDAQLFNHFQTYQAGACFTLAEISGGLACGTFVDTAEIFLVTKRIEISYVNASDQPLTARAEISNGVIERTLNALNKKNKTTIVVEVLVRDAEQKIVVRSSNEYYLRKGIPRSFNGRGESPNPTSGLLR